MSIDHVQEDRSIDMEGNLQFTRSSTTVSIASADLRLRPNEPECFICLEPPTDPISTSCGHVFCWPCMHQWLRNRPKPCPVCRYALRRDLDIIPVDGSGGAREETGYGNGRPGEIAASPSFAPPRPRNPLVVMAPASSDDATGLENFHSVSSGVPPSSVLAAYQRSISELSHALSVERARAQDMARERINLLVEENNWVRGNAILRRELEERYWQLFLVRNQTSRNAARANEVERRNFSLVREAGASQARERRLIESGIQMREHIARLQKRLDRANHTLSPGWSKGL